MFLTDTATAILRALNTPIRRIPAALRLPACVLAIVFCLFAAIHAIAGLESVFVTGDARFYLGIASGDYSQVMQPFALRQLGALVAAAVGHLLHVSVEEGFVLEGAVSLVGMLVVVYSFLFRSSAPAWLLPAIAFLPFWPMLMKGLVLPDLWCSALLALMLLLLEQEKMLAVALMMFPMMLSRESTSLTLVCFLAAGWRRLNWRDKETAVASTIAGAMVVNHLAARAQPNLEHLPNVIYMLAKVPWNFANNVLGMVPWSNINQDFCSVPAWKLPLHLGTLYAVGVCGFSSLGWMKISLSTLNEFGLLPLLTAFLWRRRRKLDLATAQPNLLLRFALLYGAASLVLAPLLGTWVERLFGYAWPLYLVALPLLFEALPRDVFSRGRHLAGAGFFSLHMFSVWFAIYTANRWVWTTQVAIELALWTIGFFLLRYWLADGQEMPAGSGKLVGAGSGSFGSAAEQH